MTLVTSKGWGEGTASVSEGWMSGGRLREPDKKPGGDRGAVPEQRSDRSQLVRNPEAQPEDVPDERRESGAEHLTEGTQRRAGRITDGGMVDKHKRWTRLSTSYGIKICLFKN